MDRKITEIMRRLDHTILSVTATTEDIKMACELAIKYGAKSVCVPPCYVKKTSRFVDTLYGRATRVCTVIGFPNGYSSTELNYPVAEPRGFFLITGKYVVRNFSCYRKFPASTSLHWYSTAPYDDSPSLAFQ